MIAPQAELLSLSWAPREEPLIAGAALGRGTVAQMLGQRILGASPSTFSAWSMLWGEDWLWVEGHEKSLPWVDGVEYLGRDPTCADLWLPTLLQPSLAPELIFRGLSRRLPHGPIALLGPGPVSAIPLALAGRRTLAEVEQWVQLR